MHYYGYSAQILLRLSKSENSPTHIFLLCATSIQRTNWGRLRSWAVVYDFASRNFYYFKVARFSCKKLSNQKHTANTVPNTRRTTFWWMRGKIKAFLFVKLTLYLSLFETYLNKTNYFDKLSRVFSFAAGFRFEEK